LGGEKLDVSTWCSYNIFRTQAVILTILRIVLIAGFFVFTSPLFAQNQEPGFVGESPAGGGTQAGPAATGVASPVGAGPGASGPQAGVASPVPATDPRSAEQSLALGEDAPGVPGSPGSASVFIIIRMILVLILAAAAIYGIVYFLKKAARPAEQKDPHLRVLASAHLGQNRFAHVVSVGTKAWLVGASDGGVSLIAELEEQEAVDAMLLDESRRNAEAPSGRFPDFKAMLRRLGAGGMDGGAGNNRGPGSISPDTIRKRRERFKGL
jgi:flagellar protein FliO/FliZ